MRMFGNASIRSGQGRPGPRPGPAALLRPAIPLLILLILPGCASGVDQAAPPAIPPALTGDYSGQIPQAAGSAIDLQAELDAEGLLTIVDAKGDFLAAQTSLSGSALTGPAVASPPLASAGADQATLTGTLTASNLVIDSGLWNTTAPVAFTLRTAATAPAPGGFTGHYATVAGRPGISPGGHGVKVVVAADGTVSGSDFEADDAFKETTGTPAGTFTCGIQPVTDQRTGISETLLTIPYKNTSTGKVTVFGYDPTSPGITALTPTIQFHAADEASPVPCLVLIAPENASSGIPPLISGIECIVYRTGP